MHVRIRIIILLLLLLVGCVSLMIRLWKMQVVEQQKYLQRLPESSTLTIRVPGLRGDIRDRNGVLLASNKISYGVLFNLKEIVEAYKKEYKTLPKTKYISRAGGVSRKREEVDIVKILNDFIISPTLEPLGLAINYNSKDLRLHYRSKGKLIPYIYRDDLTFEEFARFAEHNFYLPGVSLTVLPERLYPLGSLASHILGYLKKQGDDLARTSPEELAEFDRYIPDAFYGISGVEKTQEKFLRGKAGKIIRKVDKKGRVLEVIEFISPQKGADVFLTIDARLQYITEKALEKIGRGAGVILDPFNGDILAMASVPNFDPNDFIPSINSEKWDTLINNPTKPLFSRALNPFAPGSTYKIVTSLAACLAKIDHHSQVCTGSVNYGNRPIHCWIGQIGGAHGRLSLKNALKKSCNPYFMLSGNEAGIKSIKTIGKLLGLGSKSGIALAYENKGVLPGPDWLKQNEPGKRWSRALTAMTSIGQGYTTASPLQIASVGATIASEGKSYFPRLIDRVIAPNFNFIYQDPIRLRADLLKEGITLEQIKAIRKGMYAVVNEKGGTAEKLKNEAFTMAGKTGTAQHKPDNHAWFIAFSPYEKPKYAISIFVEAGKSGSKVAGPVASKILEEIFRLEKGYALTLNYEKPYPGNLKFNEEINYTEDSFSISNKEGEKLSYTPTRGIVTQINNEIPPQPTITAQPDIQGTIIKRARPVSKFKALEWKKNTQTIEEQPRPPQP